MMHKVIGDLVRVENREYMLDDTMIFRISLIQSCPVKNNSVANRRNNCYDGFLCL